ncbi:MAG: hypothetical protein RL757_955 [Bacteroidota bacterium]|jgi:AcrR family transcriptional regulator
MSVEEVNTEQKILEAAESVFMEEGFAGARMQQIADRASINKAMLHYYFRSKDKLFEVIFAHKMKQFVPQMMYVLHNDSISFIDKVDQFVLSYLSMLRKNPFLPLFIITATNRNPELAQQATKISFAKELVQEMEKEIAKGTIRNINPHQFMLALVGMCIFPFVARPMFKSLLELDDAAYQQIIIERHLHVMQYTRSILAKD